MKTKEDEGATDFKPGIDVYKKMLLFPSHITLQETSRQAWGSLGCIIYILGARTILYARRTRGQSLT